MSEIYNSVERSYERTIILSVRDLKEIDVFLKRVYNKVNYKLNIIDGSELLNYNLEKVLQYRNANNSRIKRIDILAKNNSDGNDETLEISFTETNHKDVPCHLIMKNVNEGTRLESEQKLEDLLRDMEAPYRWLYDGLFICIFGLIFSAILLWLIVSWHSIIGSLFQVITLSLFGIVGCFYGAKGLQIYESQRYPKCCFCLGDQKYKEVLKTNSFNNIIRPAVNSIVLSVVSGFIVSLLTR